MLIIDPTEAREGTRLSKVLVDNSMILPNLEAITGADMLVVPTEHSLQMNTKNPDAVISVANYMNQHLAANPFQVVKVFPELKIPEIIGYIKFWEACRSGIIIQRKSQRDFTGSIPHLSHILKRMLVFSDYPWLMICGQIRQKNNNAYINDTDTGYTYNAVLGALNMWQLRGGYYIVLENDNDAPQWIDTLYIDLIKITKEPIKALVKRPPAQIILAHQWWGVLMGFEGIGEVKAQRLAEKCGSIARAMELLCNPNAYRQYPEIMKYIGIGKNTLEELRLLIMKDEPGNQLVVHVMKDEKGLQSE